MTGKTHAICGAITMGCITVARFKGLELGGYTYLPAIGLLSCSAGSYFPDIDLHSSKMGRKHKFISKMFTHRGFTHTLVFPAIIFLAMTYIAYKGIPFLPDLILGFLVGYLAHIGADLFNKKGVPLLWPIVRKRIHVATFLTSSWQEYVFIPLWLVLNVAAVWFILK